jgi:hypothetical protein
MMFQGWENFYILIGSASGALIGLLFVVVTLTSNLDRDRALRGAALFMTPTVVLFTTVLMIGAIATAPGLPIWGDCDLLGAIALAGVIYGLSVVMGFIKGKDMAPHWTDIWCYAVLPAGVFLCLGLVDALIGSAPKLVPYGVAVAAIAMILLGIRNAWDLITWIAPIRNAAAAAAAAAPTDAIPPPGGDGG